MPKVEAIVGVDDVAFMCLLAGVVGSTGYVVTNNDGLSALGKSIDRYIDDNFDSDSDVAKQRRSVGATGIGASIALSSVPALMNVIKKFSSGVSSRKNNTFSGTLADINSFSEASVFSAFPYIHKSSGSFDSSTKKYSGYLLARPSEYHIKKCGSNISYVVYALTTHSSDMGNLVITKKDGKYIIPCSYDEFICSKDEANGGFSCYRRGNYAGSILSSEVISSNWGAYAIEDRSEEDALMRSYYPNKDAVSFKGDGKARTLAPEMPVTTNNITNIYQNSVSEGMSDDEALSKAIEALDHNNQVANQEMTTILNQYLSTIIAKLDSLSIALANVKTEGSSALQLDDEAVEQFKVVQNNNNNDDNNNKRPKWAKLATLAFIAPLLMAGEDLLNSSGVSNDILDGIKSGVSSGFENVKNGLNTIIEFMSSIVNAIKELPEKIFEKFKEMLELFNFSLEIIIEKIIEVIDIIKPAFESLVNNVAGILAQIQTFPQTLADIIADQLGKIEINPIIEPLIQPIIEPIIEPNIEVNPNIELSPLTNPLEEIIRLLNEILNAIKEFFNIDTEAIKDNWNRNKNEFSIEKYATPFMIVPDFDDEPPIIEVDTPSIVRGFYDKDTIVIYDARDYDKYHKIIRMIVNAILIIAYAYACLNKFKVRFSM